MIGGRRNVLNGLMMGFLFHAFRDDDEAESGVSKLWGMTNQQ